MTAVTEVINLIEKIPATFWGVVIGSFFSLGGVIVSNRANDRRLMRQLTHDRELKARERDLSVRTELYLDVVEAISTGITSLGTFANLDVPNDKIVSPYVKKSPALAKAQVIASESTASALARLTGDLSAAYLRLFVKRTPLVVRKSAQTFLQTQIDDFSKERQRLLELMKQHNLNGETDQSRWDSLERHFNFEHERISKANEEHKQRSAALLSDQLTFMNECIQETRKLSRLIPPSLAAIRTELELPFDQTAYEAVIEETIRRQEEAVGEFLTSIRPTVDIGAPTADIGLTRDPP